MQNSSFVPAQIAKSSYTMISNKRLLLSMIVLITNNLKIYEMILYLKR